jgi:hypothetical protein
MTVNAINGSLLSALSAVGEVSLSTLSAINGQALEPTVFPSTSEIIITSNAEIERNKDDLITVFSGSLASGVTGAHGRVFDNVTFLAAYDYPGGQEEFVSAGVRFYIRTDASGSLLAFIRDPDSAQVTHVRFERAVGSVMRVVQGNGTVLATGSTVISLTTWYYLMLYLRIHDTLGEFTGKIFDASGTLLETLTGSGVDTRNGTDLAERTVWGNSSADSYVDHLWVDIAGGMQGAGYVETLAASAAGDNSEWTRGGTNTGNNWDQIDEVPKNETSYVFSTGADQVDLYNFQNRSQAGTPITVQQIVYAHAHMAGTRQWKPICKIGGVIYEGATQSTTSTSDGTDPTVINWQNNPATSSAWADSEIDSAQFGVKSVTTDVRVQAVALQILVSI